MRSRAYHIRLNKIPAEIVVKVYADRSVEMLTNHFDTGEAASRKPELQTRDEAVWSLVFARMNGNTITREWL